MQPWATLRNVLAHAIVRPDIVRVHNFGSETRTIVDVPADVIEAFQALPELVNVDGPMFCIGGACTRIDGWTICDGLILRAMTEGCDKALLALSNCLKSDTFYTEISLLGGIAIRERIELTDGFSLCSPAEVPSQEFQERRINHEKQFYWPDKFGLSDRKEIGAALIRRRSNKRFCHEGDLPVVDDRYSGEVVSLLALVGPSSPIAYRVFNELDDDDLLKGRIGYSVAGNRDDTRVVKNVEVDRSAFVGFSEVIAAYGRLPEHVRTHLSVALHRLNEAVRHQSEVDKALDLGIALESIFVANEDNGIRNKFCTRGSRLLAQDNAGQAKLFDEFKQLYHLRSKAAHEGKLPAKEGVSNLQALMAGESLCATIIKKIIINGGFPDWEELARATLR